jgi:hypothetical protein
MLLRRYSAYTSPLPSMKATAAHFDTEVGAEHALLFMHAHAAALVSGSVIMTSYSTPEIARSNCLQVCSGGMTQVAMHPPHSCS